MVCEEGEEDEGGGRRKRLSLWNFAREEAVSSNCETEKKEVSYDERLRETGGGARTCFNKGGGSSRPISFRQ